ncbi:AAA family ATPase [Flavobacteriaceae bacterium R38]|nr:AAA family ATPase [Flavobacteriaceae bacterium R38]
MSTRKIVITGGPGTGKTAVISTLESAGYFCFEEVIRDMTKKAKAEEKSSIFASNPIVSVEDPLSFNIQILEGRIQQFLNAPKQCKKPVFYDRGIPDVLAYMDFFAQEYGQKFTEACENHRYEKVFILPPWKEIFTSDNERFESFDQTVGIHHSLEKIYRLFGYDPISVPFGSIHERIHFILDHLNPGI